MAPWNQMQAAACEGSLAAQRARRRLGLSLERRVDVFSVIESEGIWLMFQPLRNLFGFYRRVSGVAGIVINANHPVSLQRYTAAHEYGHHVLGHGFSLDEVRHIDGVPGVDEAREFEEALTVRSPAEGGDPRHEAAAQAFAGTFLIPVQVVNRVLLARGFDRDYPQLGPVDVYELSLEFGTSYRATVTQLAVLEKITWAETRKLRFPPIEIKTTLAAGRRPQDTCADVWLVRDTDTERDLPVRVNDEIVLRLPETPSSGYVWTLRRNQFASLEVVDEVTEAVNDEGDRHGDSAIRRMHLRAISPGVDDIAVVLRRPWEDKPLRQVVVHVHVAGEPTGDASSGLILSQQLQRALVGDVTEGDPWPAARPRPAPSRR
jgi:predicted secreted protein/Zn-dependent peptidase ImmA (M78 family)